MGVIDEARRRVVMYITKSNVYNQKDVMCISEMMSRILFLLLPFLEKMRLEMVIGMQREIHIGMVSFHLKI